MLNRSIRTVLVASCAALALSACREDNREASAALGYGVAPSALAYDPTLAPDADALPATRPAPVGRLVSYDDGYAWAERAYAMDRAFYDAPPDYGFYYEDVEPWVWESEDHWTMYAEPISDGYRYYYYEPGDEYPYFVRDDEYGYGYDDAGRLVTLYTVAGVLLPLSYLDQRADWAGRYWHRAHDLRRAAAGDRRARIAREQWLARQPVFVRSQEPWMEAAVRRDDWRSYRVRHEQRDVRRFERERQRREAVAERLNRDELQRAGRDWRDRREGRQVAALAPEAQGRWAWGGRRDDDARRGYGERRLDDRRDGDRDRRWAERQGERQQLARVEGERRGRDEMRARQEQRRQQMAEAQAERRGRDQMQAQQRQQMARIENERRGRQDGERRNREQAQAERAQQRQQMAQAQNERRGRQEAERRGREQQARAEGERRNREQAQAERAQQRQQMAQAQNERRGRQEAERRGREQQARAEGERRGREQMQAQRAQQRQQAENERRGREQQARAEGERRGREQAQAQRQAQQQQAQQARQEARNAQQAARDAGGRERGDRGQGRGGGRRED